MSLQTFVQPPQFDDYKQTFEEFFDIERRDDGVLLAKAHTALGDGDEAAMEERAAHVLTSRITDPGRMKSSS